MNQNPNDEEQKAESVAPAKGFLDSLESDPNEDPEALLAEALPNLEKDMKQIQSDFIGLNADIEPLEFGEDSTVPIVQSESFKVKLKKIKKKIQAAVVHLGEKIFYRLKYLAIWLIIEFPKKLLTIWIIVAKELKKLSQVYSKWSTKRKILFFISIISITATSYIYYKVIKGNLLTYQDYQFYGSMDELADHSFSYDVDSDTEPFYNSPRVKVYSFKMKAVVVNLKVSEESNGTPMAYFEFVFVGNSGDVVVEFKNRESEMIDLVERVIETKTFEALDTVEGKEELKEDIQRELNKKLTDGAIKKVEIHNFFIKP